MSLVHYLPLCNLCKKPYRECLCFDNAMAHYSSMSGDIPGADCNLFAYEPVDMIGGRTAATVPTNNKPNTNQLDQGDN